MQYINTNITIEYYGILGNGKLNKVQDFDTKAKTIQRQYLFFTKLHKIADTVFSDHRGKYSNWGI